MKIFIAGATGVLGHRTVTGLLGDGLVLQLNDDELLPVAGDGPFQFNTVLASGASYDVDIALLSTAGTLRVFSLETETGVLFLFPMRNGAIVVLTKPKVNIGAVLSARAALEEAA